MDNNELDKIIKEKLKGQIIPSKEFEQKIQNSIKEQKQTYKKSTNNSKYAKMKVLVSIAAVALIAFVLGISLKDNGINFEEKTVTIASITDIKPTKSSNEVLASDSEFLIYAQGENLTEESVQKVLYIEPALEYNISKTNNENEYKLTFKQNIPNNTIVKLQYVKDKITQDSWAYQTSNELSINRTYPAKGEMLVSKDTVIEIEFSHATVENLEDNVEILPKINGKWEHLGKIWRFTPEQELAEETYYVKVKNGIVAEQKTLKNEYTFSFMAKDAPNIDYFYNTTSIDKINTYKTDEPVRIYCSGMYTKLEISKIEIGKFESKDEFINYLIQKNIKNIMDALYLVSPFLHEYFGTNSDYTNKNNRSSSFDNMGNQLGEIKEKYGNSMFNDYYNKWFDISIFKNNSMAECTEYAALTQNLFSFIGANSYYVLGSFSSDEGKSESHAFNLVQLDADSFFIVDTANPTITYDMEYNIISSRPRIQKISRNEFIDAITGNGLNVDFSACNFQINGHNTRKIDVINCNYSIKTKTNLKSK